MKKLKYILLIIPIVLLINIGVNAGKINYSDIPNNSYIIGTTLYTSNISLTTKHIMLASKTISKNELENMCIYYKTPRGKLIDGLTGQELIPLSSYTIDYEDIETISNFNYEDNYIKQEYSKDDIPNNSYVIGTHLYTSNISLTTKHIMLAAKTINGSSINDMKIYYKTPRGKWINGLSGEEVVSPTSYEISHIDLVKLAKQKGYVTLEEYEKEVAHKTNSITFNVVSSHGGNLTVSDDNETAISSISGNTVTVNNLSTLNVGTNITVTVKSAETNDYTEGAATYRIIISETAATLNKLYVSYYSSDGIWNSSSDEYTYDISDGYVHYISDGGVYKHIINDGDELTNTLFDYNGTWFNWTREGYGVPVKSEYYILNGNNKTYLDQTEVYSAEYLAQAAGCDLKIQNCNVVVNLNWKEYLIKNADFLKTEGTKFVKSGINGSIGDGQEVLLRGFNLGEWLSRAITLSPFTDVSQRSCSDNIENAYTREYTDNNVQINYALYRNFYEKEYGNITASKIDGLLTNNEIFKKVFNVNEAYYSNFINEDDITKLAEMGVNSVRVPVEWSYFAEITNFIGPTKKPTVECGSDYSSMNEYKYEYSLLSGYDSEYNVIKGSYLEKRMKHLDWIVDACRRNGIYVIFDLHVVPGSANAGGIISKRGGYTFFDKQSGIYTQEAQKAQQTAVDIWRLIAKRFNGNPGVAGYELINEPGSATSDDLFNFYKVLFTAIREKDSNHIIIMESPMLNGVSHYLDYSQEKITWDMSKTIKMPYVTDNNWDNVAYSVHDYYDNGSIMPDVYTLVDGEYKLGKSDGLADDLDRDGNGSSCDPDDIKTVVNQKIDRIVEEREKYGVPIFVGETNWRWNCSNQTWPEILEMYNRESLSYNFWSYKVAGDAAMGLVYNLPDGKEGYEYAKLLTDDYETILSEFKRTTLNGGYEFNSNKNYFGMIQNSILRNVEIQYNGNGGTWNQVKDTYNVNSNEFVVKNGTNDIYKQKINSGVLPSTGLVDYNGSWFNWTKDNNIAMPGAEYFVVNNNDPEKITYFDQSKVYTAKELASAQGCYLSTEICTVTVNVNWKENIKVALIGNSKTFYNEHPNVFEELTNMLSGNLIYTIEKISKESSSLLDKSNYSINSDVLVERMIATSLQNNAYDIAILQEKTSLLNVNNIETFNQGVDKISKKLKDNNRNVLIYLRESWQNIDDLFNANQEKTFKNIQTLSYKNKYDIIHDGKAFSKYSESKSLSDLFISDNMHASYKGAYLSAACIYSKLTRNDPTKITYHGNINEADAKELQTIAKSVCYQ